MIFGPFSKMVSNLPAQAVLRAIDLECKTLEDNVKFDRLIVNEEVMSIFCFRQFLRMVKTEDVIRCLKPLPADHLEFYKETIFRLVDATELPASAVEQFEEAFPIAL